MQSIHLSCALYNTGYRVQYSVQGTMYSVQCTVYNVQCTMYSVQYSVRCTVYNIVYSVQYSIQCTTYNIVYSVHSKLKSISTELNSKHVQTVNFDPDEVFINQTIFPHVFTNTEYESQFNLVLNSLRMLSTVPQFLLD